MSGAVKPFEKPKKLSKPRKVSRFAARPGIEIPMGRQRPVEKVSDEYGLSVELYRYVSPLGRRYIAHALEHLGMDKHVSPVEQGTATIPELVVYGGLLLRGFEDLTLPDGRGGQGRQPRSFVFRKVWFSGFGKRVAEVDFSIWHQGELIAVMVDGAFHRADHPAHVGGEAMAKDKRQWFELGATEINRVLSVNKDFELETGPSALVEREMQRVLGRV